MIDYLKKVLHPTGKVFASNSVMTHALRSADGMFPVAYKMADEVICLPMHHELTEEDVERVLDCIVQ